MMSIGPGGGVNLVVNRGGGSKQRRMGIGRRGEFLLLSLLDGLIFWVNID